MDQLTVSLGPVFVAGFAVQQLLEILTSLLNLDERPTFQKYKKVILGIVSLIFGLLLALLVPAFMVFRALKVDVPGALDVLISGFVLSAGTEGVNSIVKFLKYAKEDKKVTAAAKESSAQAAAAGNTTTNATALLRMNRL